jgi:hypothetical protein
MFIVKIARFIDDITSSNRSIASEENSNPKPGDPFIGWLVHRVTGFGK